MDALKKPYRLALFHLLLLLPFFLSGCSLGIFSSISPTPPTKPLIRTFDLSAQQNLRDLTADFSVREAGADTGITLFPDEKVEIFAAGSASTWSGKKPLGPEGLPGCHERTMPEPSLSCYAVMYSLGVNGRAGEVGKQVGFHPPTEGNLFLGINAPHVASNRGSFHMTVLVVPSGTFTGLWRGPQDRFAVQGTNLTLSAYIIAQNVTLDGIEFTMTRPGQTSVSICRAIQSGKDIYTCNWDLTLNGIFFPNGPVTLGFRLNSYTTGGTTLVSVINPDGVLTGTITYAQTQPNDNYAGYAATAFTQSTTYQKVTGRWVVPPAHCSPGEDSDASIWVGMSSDASDQSLLAQLGTATDCQAGSPLYDLWWEMFPAPSVPLDLPLQAGDTVTATVAFRHGAFQLSIDVPSEGVHFSTTQAGTVSDTSTAECIVEPETIIDNPTTNSGHVEQLTSFGQVSIHCQLDENKPIATGPQDILYQMQTAAGVAKAVTSALDPTGTTFVVQWHHG